MKLKQGNVKVIKFPFFMFDKFWRTHRIVWKMIHICVNHSQTYSSPFWELVTDLKQQGNKERTGLTTNDPVSRAHRENIVCGFLKH